MNKKGAEMTVGTIIIIVLALIVLVILVYGFSTGWTNLWEKVTGFGGGEINVQSAVQSCQLACTTGSTYDWCTKKRDIVFEDDSANAPYTCNELVSVSGTGLEDCAALKANCVSPINCDDMDKSRNELYTAEKGFTRCPVATDTVNSLDSQPVVGSDGVSTKPAWCCRAKSTSFTQQQSLEETACKAFGANQKSCEAAGCKFTTGQCTNTDSDNLISKNTDYKAAAEKVDSAAAKKT